MDIREADPEAAAGCVRMFDTFTHDDAGGGRFFCLVFEVLGASLYDILKQNRYRGLWVQDIQSVIQQCLSALRFLHDEMQLTHTDLKLENVLFVTTQPHLRAVFPREAFWQKTRKSSGRSAVDYVRPASTRIKLIDFGNATYDLEHHSSIINTRQYRAPEVILALGWNERSDLWSIGCILMELYTGELLFRTHESVEHLALMERAIEPFPQSMLDAAGPNPKEHYLVQDADEGCWRLNWPAAASSTSERHVRHQQPLSQLVLSPHRSLAEFAAAMLILDPRSRPSAGAALLHPFLFQSFQD